MLVHNPMFLQMFLDKLVSFSFSRWWLGLAIVVGQLITPNLVLADNTQLQREIKTLDRGLEKEEKKALALREEVRALEKKLGVQTRKIYTLNKKIKKLDKRLLKATKESAPF